MNTRILLLSAVALGCASQRAEQNTSAPVAAATSAEKSDAEVLPFIENDYAGAVAEAKAKGLPLFVDVWAPW